MGSFSNSTWSWSIDGDGSTGLFSLSRYSGVACHGSIDFSGFDPGDIDFFVKNGDTWGPALNCDNTLLGPVTPISNKLIIPAGCFSFSDISITTTNAVPVGTKIHVTLKG